MEPISFVLKNMEHKLRLEIINIGSTDILVNNRFSLGREGKRGNIILCFTDENSVKHNLSAKINYGKESDSDLTLLEPNKMIEKEIGYNDLMDFYDLKPGKYIVKGFYVNNYGVEKGAFVGRVESSPITIEFQ